MEDRERRRDPGLPAPADQDVLRDRAASTWTCATSSPTAQYWCSRTATVMGPDDVSCSPEMCQPHRGCFETE